MPHILLFAENSFECAVHKPTLLEARAFSDGCRTGASFYGAGSLGAYVYPNDLGAMHEFEETDEIARALAKLGPQEPTGNYRVMRQDDNGNKFELVVGISEVEADTVVKGFEELRHKQTYWVEAISD